MPKDLVEPHSITEWEIQHLPLYVVLFVRQVKVLGYKTRHNVLDIDAASWLCLKVTSPTGKVDISVRYDPLMFDPECRDDLLLLAAQAIVAFAYEHAIPTATQPQ